MKKIVIAVLTLVFCAALFVGCVAEEETFDNCHKVVFELEGGKYKNSDKAVTYYYNIPEGESCKIRNISEFDSDDTLSRAGYVLEGWYRTKNEQVVGGQTVVTYSDKWDFDNDTVSGVDETILYAYWKLPIVHSYELYVFHDKNVLLGEYEVYFGSAFNDFSDYAHNSENSPFGYTFIEYVDENGESWATHGKTHSDPNKGETIKVYAKYIKGEYQLISKASDFASLDSAKDLYLMCDIDFSQADEKYREINFGNFMGRTFDGNGHTLSNFAIKYSASNLVADYDPTVSGNSLYVSLFGNGKNSTIKNVNFQNVSVSVKTENSKTSQIYVAPLFANASNCKVENVNVQLTVKVEVLPTNINDIILYDSFFGRTEETNTATNSTKSISRGD